MRPLQILPSTTSHKHEALIPTLDVFARLGFRDLDLNLNHIVERDVKADAVLAALDANEQRACIVSGGWCDFLESWERARSSLVAVGRQAMLARQFGADRLRLFFGRLSFERYTRESENIGIRCIQVAADRWPDLLLMFENHDGASSHPDVCRAILDGVNRPNVRLTFDPINFEHRGVRTEAALSVLQPLVGHVHLKGYANGAFCGFGEGEVDLIPALQQLIAGGYDGAFTVEYEGEGDRTLRLFESVRRAEAAIARIVAEQVAG